MNRRTLRILEFDKIRQQLAGFAASKGAKQKALQLMPSSDPVQIGTLQQNTRDAFLRLDTDEGIGFSGTRDIRESLRLLSIGSALTAEELLNIAALLENADDAIRYNDKRETADSLSPFFETLVPLRDISGEIRRCILSADEIADDASPHLRSIRRKITSKNASLHGELEKIIRNPDVQDKLMDAIITTRGGRYCVPVRAEYRNAFPGMIHDRSATGATLFIEPLEAVNLNNEIAELHDDERKEILKILEDLSRMAGSATEDIRRDYETLTELDFIFAKGRLAKETRATQPELNEEGIADLHAAVHPLLDRKTAVPVDIRLGEDFTLLIITGPNTGGKTVCLKTLGLLSLMSQSGLHIPAAEGSRLPVFRDIFADIGDEQSIEQNLSTFSSHMKNIIYIVKHADQRDLVLLDEPGGGTDPAEGASLAIAILRDLQKRQVRVMATTHYTELKTFAIGTPGVENASCEFDTRTLMPTYRLMIGVPGSSNAFAIARRLGMPESVTTDAESHMDQNQVDMENIINELETARRTAAKDQEKIAEMKLETARLKQSLSDKEKNIDKRRDAILSKARAEAQSIVSDAKSAADDAIRDYNRWRAHPEKADPRAMEQQRTKLRKKAESYDRKRPAGKREVSGQKSSDFHIGDKVLVLSLHTEGHVLELPDSGGRVLVGMGILTSRFPVSDLVILPEDKKAAEKENTFTASGVSSSKAYTFRPEINLIGKTVDEATVELDRFLDDALLTHAGTVRIVHGKGTGALRRGIREYLKKQKFVKEVRDGEYGEGDTGVTVVELK